VYQKLFTVADKKKTTSVVLVEEDIAVLGCEETPKEKKFSINRLAKRFKQIDFTKIQV
jgi:hypothetical protein